MENKSLRLGLATHKKNLIRDLNDSMGKIPPQAVEYEEAVLGALMLEKDASTAVMDILKTEHFYKDAHQDIYEAIIELSAKSDPIDMLTVTDQLRKSGKLEVVGGAYYITQLTSKVSSAANIEKHARVIIEKAIKREMIRIASEIHRDAYEDTSDAFELLDKMEAELYTVSEVTVKKDYQSMPNLMVEAIQELEAKKGKGEGVTGIHSGFMALDRITSGWQRTDLIIIAARPAMGKTAFVVSALRNAAVEFKHPVAIFSLEMSSLQLVNRLISAEAELGSEKLKKGTLEEHEWHQLTHKTERLAEAPIYIDDTPALSIMELRTKARKLVKNHGVSLIVIDYLQLMSGDSSKSGGVGGNREQEIASISRSLKNIAKELNVPIIALSQLSRAVETRGGDKRPQLSDLRESGSIEQDADMVMFLYRPEYYNITQDEEGNNLQGVGEIIIAKHRNGSLDTVRLKFIGQYTKFTDLDFSGGFGNQGGGFASLGGGDFDSGTDSVIFQSKANASDSGDFPSGGNGGFGYKELPPADDAPF